jgi:hypothetical protein
LTPAEQVIGAGHYDRWRLGCGFERYYGFLSCDTSQYYPDLVRDNRQIEPEKTPEEGYYLTPDLVDTAILLGWARAIEKYAVAYAEKVERDYERFRIAVRNGLIETEASRSLLETMIARGLVQENEDRLQVVADRRGEVRHRYRDRQALFNRIEPACGGAGRGQSDCLRVEAFAKERLGIIYGYD